jgi:PTS system nitrogen regulatory IIA component
MDIADFLTVDRVVLGTRTRDKASLLADVGRITANHLPPLSASAIESALRVREQLGSTGLGGGFALPHARIEGLRDFAGFFFRLGRPIEFDSIDGTPVDLVFLLLIPAEAADHVSALAAVSRRFRNGPLVVQIRKSATPAAAFGLLTSH